MESAAGAAWIRPGGRRASAHFRPRYPVGRGRSTVAGIDPPHTADRRVGMHVPTLTRSRARFRSRWNARITVQFRPQFAWRSCRRRRLSRSRIAWTVPVRTAPKLRAFRKGAAWPRAPAWQAGQRRLL